MQFRNIQEMQRISSVRAYDRILGMEPRLGDRKRTTGPMVEGRRVGREPAGKTALQHLDSLLEIDRLNAIE
jgi:hypothetical protein